MFDFLKKKISGFIDGITKKEEAKVVEKEQPLPEPSIGEAAPEPEIEKPAPQPVPEKEKKKPAPEIKKRPEPAREIQEKPELQKPEIAKKPEPKKTETPKQEIAKKPELKKTEPSKPEIAKMPEAPKPETKVVVEAHERKVEAKSVSIPPYAVEKKAPVPEKKKPPEKERKAPEPEKRKTPEPEIRKAPELPKFVSEEKREEKSKVRLSPIKAITSFITREVEISEDDVREMLESLELELLESDVELGVAESIRQELRQKLVGAKVSKGELNSYVREAIRGTLLDTMSVGRGIDLPAYVRERDEKDKPVKIVFLGINGAGKTTTIAKVAHLLMQNKLQVAFAAADTFRAAAIEQMEVHANRLDVRLIKRDYGSDPTSVAYDAVNYARAHRIDAILIDTAGRQDTNVNLINELKKMDRVIKPDLKIYIGESIAGSSIIEQVSSFNREIGVDGVILTKLDCDPKGGTVISISKATGIPIIYIGTGQKYEDIEKFDARKMAERILG